MTIPSQDDDDWACSHGAPAYANCIDCMRTDPSGVPVVILAGGRGARFDHESQVLPKPMIPVAGRPILQHIIDGFIAQGFREFIVLTGYLGSEIDAHFRQLDGMAPWTYRCDRSRQEALVRTVDTGIDSHTGSRLWQARHFIGRRRFVLTYGDGLSDVDMTAVLRQHDETGAGVTVTAVRPPNRFGVITFSDPPDPPTEVMSFDEHPSLGWINGGFMVVEPEFIEQYIEGEFELESTALRELAASGGLHAHRHTGYWRCMDTRRDRDQIEEDVRAAGRLPWLR